MADRILLLLSALAVLVSAMPSQLQSDLDDLSGNEVDDYDRLLDELLDSTNEEQVVEWLIDMRKSGENDAMHAVMRAMVQRTKRPSYGGCRDGPRAHSPFCVYLKEHLAGKYPHPHKSGGESGDFGSGSKSASRSGSASSASSSPTSSASAGASSGASAGARAGFGIHLEPSYSHDACLSPVTYVVREAVEYLPTTIYNTQHLILPSTRVLTMVETEGYPQPVYETVTSVLSHPDKIVTATVVQQTERTLDVNSARQTDVLLRSTKLHIFTDTKDYFWTKTEFLPYYETVTETTTSDVQTDISHKETRYEDRNVYVTITSPHVITHTSTSSTVVRTYVTETKHQYRYVAVTPVPVTETETVTRC